MQTCMHTHTHLTGDYISSNNINIAGQNSLLSGFLCDSKDRVNQWTAMLTKLEFFVAWKKLCSRKAESMSREQGTAESMAPTKRTVGISLES